MYTEEGGHASHTTKNNFNEPSVSRLFITSTIVVMFSQEQQL